ncbi:hypothetical protein JTE90_008984 [Oedothorax gibbosus]|uniref:Uncharacterized protein n=1 Tax=Oedothorax gibbosus TaxID=931172 RepID=A0AAV6UKS7_9ARAC|nr:hypothetical protein JTE90_008984 [Oedothorax gibbosus]
MGEASSPFWYPKLAPFDPDSSHLLRLAKTPSYGPKDGLLDSFSLPAQPIFTGTNKKEGTSEVLCIS